MSIVVKNISKIYGIQKAVDNISFTVNDNEIIGFLGPNGAGKSSTLKMITCFLTPDEGSIEVCGIDVLKNPFEAKKLIGYLPESNSLYNEMYIKEYLLFLCDVHKIKNKKKTINNVIEKVGLGLEQHKKIAQLSKGYKQRVGIASAIIHNPKVLILDEPTTGLDPNQIIEIRNLIVELGKEKTVLFSSHILQEVKAICKKVIIINKGKIVANDQIEHLNISNEKIRTLAVSFEKIIDQKVFENFDVNVEKVSDNTYHFKANDISKLQQSILNLALKNDWNITNLQIEESALENIFSELTTKK